MTPSEEEVTVEKLDLKPEWLEKTGPERRDVFGFHLVFLLTTAVLFILLLFTAGNLKQFVGFALLVWIALFIVYTTGKHMKSIPVWRRNEGYDETENMPLRRDSDTMERALRGLELSQTVVERRLRRAFMEKLMDEKDISMKEMRRLLKNQSQLKKIVDDEDIEDFLLNSKRIEDVIVDKDDESSVFLKRQKEKDGSFEKKIREMMKKISGWEIDKE